MLQRALGIGGFIAFLVIFNVLSYGTTGILVLLTIALLAASLFGLSG